VSWKHFTFFVAETQFLGAMPGDLAANTDVIQAMSCFISHHNPQNLSIINLSSWSASSQSVINLLRECQRLPNLRKVSLNQTAECITDQAMVDFILKCQALQTLQIQQCGKDGGFIHLMLKSLLLKWKSALESVGLSITDVQNGILREHTALAVSNMMTPPLCEVDISSIWVKQFGQNYEDEITRMNSEIDQLMLGLVSCDPTLQRHSITIRW